MYRIYYDYELNKHPLVQIIEADSQKEAKMKFYSQGVWTKDASITAIVDLFAEDNTAEGRFYTYKELDTLKQEYYEKGFEDAQDEEYHRKLEESTL